MGPFIVPRTMASTASATLAVPFKIKGTNYTMSSVCNKWTLHRKFYGINSNGQTDVVLLVEVKKFIGP